ncbi:MAG TPA: tetratricopeptide repeat protein, partial [Thermoanaerobaculia bacterium]|nr:tetratricopeptide repeat protein [Thermoanaerobaculia bacterium]
MAYFVAFYSYKGGVGRSLALSNVAYSLAERGKRVVLVDMDLEAPNLHSVPEFALKGSSAKKGFVEYADSYRRTGTCPAIGSYVHRCNKSPGTGELWLMPAGQFGAEYQPKLASLTWRKLHPRNGTEPFIDELRKALTEKIQPHYVLIDSRTGLSDIGGLSTHRLADMVVLVFNLTRSCMEGSIRTYRSFVSDVSRIQAVQLLASPVPPALPGSESIVKSRLDQAVKLMPQGVAFGRELIQIAYDPAMVLMEELPVRHPDLPAAQQYEDLREAIQRANPEEVFPVFEQAIQFRSEGRLEDGLGLLREFIKANPRNAEAYLALGNLLFEAGRAREAANDFRSARDLEPGLALVHRRLGEALVVEEQAAEAVEALKQAEKLGDRSRELYVALTRAYGQLKEPAKELEARRKALTALLGSPDRIGEDTSALPELRRELVQVLRRRPPYAGFDAEAFWGQVMGSLSMSLQEKTRLLRDVLEGALEARSLRTLLQSLEEENQSWLETLGSNAPELQKRVAESFVDITQEEAALRLRRGGVVDAALLGLLAAYQAEDSRRRSELLEEAVRIDPSSAELLFALGTTLAALAGLAEGEERKDLFQQAAAKYQEAIRLKPDKHEALNNWGITLAALARLAEGEERKDLFQQAASKYREAIRIKPDKHEALYNWGNALAALAELAEGEERKDLFQ